MRDERVREGVKEKGRWKGDQEWEGGARVGEREGRNEKGR